MTWSPVRFPLPVGVLPLFILACAHSHETAQAPSPAPPPQPPSTATSGDLGQQAVSVEQLLAGKISGVVVTPAPGGGLSIRIQGPSSFSLTQQPLYVVDGVPVQPGPNGTLSWLNARDIESIMVLKYDADKAIYGVLGANGVIVIRTKGSR